MGERRKEKKKKLYYNPTRPPLLTRTTPVEKGFFYKYLIT